MLVLLPAAVIVAVFFCVVASCVVRLPSALLLTDTLTSLPEREPSSNFIVLNSVVSEILVSSL